MQSKSSLGYEITLDSVLQSTETAKALVTHAERKSASDLLDSVLGLTDSYNAAAAERVRQIEKNIAWGKAERERITALDKAAERERIAQEKIEADISRMLSVWSDALDARAQEKEWKRRRRNNLARLARARRRKARRRICVCGHASCRIGPFNLETEAND